MFKYIYYIKEYVMFEVQRKGSPVRQAARRATKKARK